MNNIPAIIVSGIGVATTTIPLLLTEGFFVAGSPPPSNVEYLYFARHRGRR